MDFARIVMLVAVDANQDKELQKLSRRVQLIATKVALEELMDIERRKSIVVDRLRDCAECKRQGSQSCLKGGGCTYKTEAFKLQAIQKHYGADVLRQAMPKLDEYIRKHTKEET